MIEKENMNIEYSFPIDQSYSNEYLKTNFWKCNYTTGEEQFHYWVILPNNVKPNKLEFVKIEQLSLTNIGQYVRNDASPYLEVQLAFENYEFEMNASDWLKKKLYIMGETIINERIIKGKSTGNYIDVLCKKQIGGVDIISRYTVLKDYNKKIGGANYFCIKASCEGKDYENLSLDILQIVTNWELINKSDWQMAELLSPFMDNFVEPVKFFVPYSWEGKYLNSDEINYSHNVFEHKIENINKGVINTFFYKLNSFNNILEVFENNLRRFERIDDVKINIIDSGIVSKDQIQNPFIEDLFSATGNLDSETSDFHSNITLAIIKTNLGWYYFESIGSKPNLQNNYYEVNKRCLQIMINSFNNLNFEISS